MIERRLSYPVSESLRAPPAASDAIAMAHRRYWRFNLALIGVLMAIGFSVSFIFPLFARQLASVRFAGFRLPFYVGAQGAILIYLALIGVYIVLMTFADRMLRRAVARERSKEPAREAAP
jgi:putative solute:sodium symporter small subunit